MYIFVLNPIFYLKIYLMQDSLGKVMVYSQMKSSWKVTWNKDQMGHMAPPIY